ncbi:hypothetical protein [Bernardetia sp.]|uniref:hypothetical protein n=1 Tax=Bernardetia sp. TaxID=1937974 RepID=UPI0025C318AA|nr:hypothetical protein [Bernardetia sp.]
MRYLLTPFITILVIFLFGFINTKDEVLNQSEILKGVNPNQEYITFTLQKSGEDYSFVRERYINKITEIISEKNMPSKHFQVMVELSTRKPASYLPDNWAFPITYRKSWYEGDEKDQETIGYIPRELRTGMSESRLVFLDGIIYELSGYYSPEKYSLYSISVPIDYGKKEDKREEGKEKKKMSLKEKLKAMKGGITIGDPIAKKLQEDDVVERLKVYLNAANKKQEIVHSKWANSQEGKLFLENLELKREAFNKSLQKEKEEYYKSDLYKRIQRNNRLAEGAAATSSVTLVNNTGHDIRIYEEGSYNGFTLRNGSTSRFDCEKNLYSASTSAPNVKHGGGSLVVSGGTSCGQTIEIN